MIRWTACAVITAAAFWIALHDQTSKDFVYLLEPRYRVGAALVVSVAAWLIAAWWL
jgi:hypothetical protein